MVQAKRGKKEIATQSGSQSHSNVIIKISHIKRIFKENFRLRVGRDALICVSVVCGYLMSEVLDGAKNTCSADGKKKISPKHINTAISKDAELNHVGHSWIIKSGGLKSCASFDIGVKKHGRD